MKTVTVDTHVSTEGLTLASRTAAIGGTETRAAAAEARRVLLELAAERLDAPVGELTIAKGVVSVRGDARRSVTYAELVGDKSFDRTFEQFAYNGGIELPRKSADHATPKARDALSARRHSRAAARHRRENPRHLSIRSARSSARDAARPRRVAARARRARHQQSHRRQRRRVLDRGHCRRADRPAQQFRRRRGRARVGCRARRAPIEGHVAAVRLRAARPRELVRQLPVGEDQRPGRHGYRRRRRRARARCPPRLGHVSRAVSVAWSDGAELRGRRRDEPTPRS